MLITYLITLVWSSLPTEGISYSLNHYILGWVWDPVLGTANYFSGRKNKISVEEFQTGKITIISPSQKTFYQNKAPSFVNEEKTTLELLVFRLLPIRPGGLYNVKSNIQDVVTIIFPIAQKYRNSALILLLKYHVWLRCSVLSDSL